MFRKATIALASIAVGSLVFGVAANSAQAQFVYPAPVYAPAPVYYPAPVYVAPPPVVYYPRPAYYAPVYGGYGYASYARPYYHGGHGFSFGFGWHH